MHMIELNKETTVDDLDNYSATELKHWLANQTLRKIDAPILKAFQKSPHPELCAAVMNVLEGKSPLESSKGNGQAAPEPEIVKDENNAIDLETLDDQQKLELARQLMEMLNEHQKRTLVVGNDPGIDPHANQIIRVKILSNRPESEFPDRILPLACNSTELIIILDGLDPEDWYELPKMMITGPLHDNLRRRCRTIQRGSEVETVWDWVNEFQVMVHPEDQARYFQ